MLEHIFLSVISTSLSVGLVIILLTVLTPLIDRRYTAKWKYLVWILLALRLVIPIDPVNTQNFIQNLKVETAVEEMHSAEKPLTPVPQQPRLSRRIVLEIPSGMNEPMTQSDENIQITPLMFLIGIWLTGSAIFVCIHLYSYLHYRRLLQRDGTRIKDQRLLKLLRELSDELHLTQKVSIVKYAVADSPMMIGFLRPVLVLPTETYSDEALYYILKHEMVHFMRHDVYWKLLFVLANAIHWFNPAVWLLHKEAVVDMELSCDERVVLRADHKSKIAYTETLYTMLHQKYTQKHPLSTQFYGGKRIMQKRFRNILGYSVKRNGFYILVCTFILMIGAGILIGCSVADKDRLDRPTEQERTAHADRSNTDIVKIPESPETPETELPQSTTLTYIMEGEPVEETASLYVGNGYSIYVPDDEWEPYGTDRWRFVYNDRIRFWITCYEQSNLDTVKKELGDTQALIPVMESDRENEMEGQKEDIITRVRLVEQPEANCVWAVYYSYPEEAIEGAGARLPVIADTFCSADIYPGYIINLWEFNTYADEADPNVLEFQNGLRLILPQEWAGRTILEISTAGHTVAAEYDSHRIENRLAVYEKNNAEANYGGQLIFLDYIRRNQEDYTYSAESPYTIYGDKAAEMYRVLGVYRQDGQEYALIYAKYPAGGYGDDINVSPDDPELQKDYQDLYALADNVQIITDSIPGFTKCDVNDLDWIYIEGLSDKGSN